jgi:hypothetical protein
MSNGTFQRGLSIFWLMLKIGLILLLVRSETARFIYQNF